MKGGSGPVFRALGGHADPSDASSWHSYLFGSARARQEVDLPDPDPDPDASRDFSARTDDLGAERAYVERLYGRLA